LGLNVVVDVAHHDVEILSDCARRLVGLPVLFVGVRCPLETIVERRHASEPGSYAAPAPGEPVPISVLRWQHEVHGHWAYDLEVDASERSPQQCAAAIRQQLAANTAPTAFDRLIERG
jgi:chloramphenicol 3-O phosphotransferase